MSQVIQVWECSALLLRLAHILHCKVQVFERPSTFSAGMLLQSQALQGKCKGPTPRGPIMVTHPISFATSRRQHQVIICKQTGAGGPSAGGAPRNSMPAQPAPASDAPTTPSAALVRRPAPQQTIYIDMSQVVGKQVITRTTGRNLGTVSSMWVDPVRYEVVSLDIDDKKGVGSTRVANIPLARLTQIGDVVLVHDETVLYDAPLDGRYGYMLLTGMEVRTRSGEFLGKVGFSMQGTCHDTHLQTTFPS